MADSINDLMYAYFSGVIAGTLNQNVTVTNSGPAVQLATSVTDTNTVTTPAAGAAIATTASLPAGTYDIDVTTFIGGTTVAATEINNMRLLVGGTAITRIINPVAGTAGATSNAKVSVRAVLATSGTAQVVAVALATTGAIYGANIVARRIA